MTAATAFDVARRLRDPEFRAWLTAHGYTPGMEIYAAAVGETDETVRLRMARGTHLLIVSAPSEPNGLRARLVEGPADGPEPAPPMCDRRWGDGQHACDGMGEHECGCCCGEKPGPTVASRGSPRSASCSAARTCPDTSATTRPFGSSGATTTPTCCLRGTRQRIDGATWC